MKDKNKKQKHKYTRVELGIPDSRKVKELLAQAVWLDCTATSSEYFVNKLAFKLAKEQGRISTESNNWHDPLPNDKEYYKKTIKEMINPKIKRLKAEIENLKLSGTKNKFNKLENEKKRLIAIKKVLSK